MPVIQNDWVTIKAKMGDRTALYALTTAQASLLLSIAPQLTWRKTYRAFGYDFSDWDYLQAEVADLQRGLMMPVYIDDLIGKLDELTDAVFSLYCCPDGTPLDLTEGNEYVDHYTENEANGVPDNIVSSGYADDDDDWEGFYDYKCMVSHVAIESLAQKLDAFEQLSDNATIGILTTGAIVAIMGTIIGVISGGTFVIVLAILAGIAGVANMYSELTDATEGLFSDAAEEVRDNAEALACALFLGDGADASYSNLLAKAGELLSVTTAGLVGLMNMKIDIKALYSGRYDEQDVAQKLFDLGYQVSGFSCNCADTPAGYHLVTPTGVGAFQFTNCNEEDSGYNPETGIVRFDVTSTGGNWNVKVDFTLPGAADSHGYIWRLLSANHPEDVPAIMWKDSPPGYIYHPDDLGVGEYAAGYDESIHSGAEWDNWVNQYDHVEGGLTFSAKRIRLQDYISPQSDRYTYQIRVWYLVAD
jgi:hypothetical protein